MRNINNLKKRFKSFLNIFWKTTTSFSKKELVLVLLLITLISVTTFQVTEVKKNPLGSGDYGLKKGIYNEALVGSIKHLNPLFVDYNEIDRDICSLIFSGLTRFNPETDTFEPDLATFTTNEDNTIYTFVLKDNIKWHDQEPITADDVYFTYHDIIQSLEFKNPILKSNYNGIEITKIDDRTIEFKLSEPNSFFITNTTTGIVPKHILQDYKPEDMDIVEFNTKPIGSGPYKLSSFQKGASEDKMIITLEAFEEYYGTIPQISKFKFIVFGDETSLMSEKDTFNGIAKVPADSVEMLTEDTKLNLLPYKLPQYTALFLNNDSEILDENKMRIALSKSIDKQSLLNQLENVEIVNTPLLELNESDWINKYNIEEAQGALYDSGWKIETDDEGQKSKYRADEDGNELKLTLLILKHQKDTKNYIESKFITDFLTEKWAEVGINLEVKEFEIGDLLVEMKMRNYDLILYKQSLGYNKDTYSFWHSSQATSEGMNISNFKSFAVDSLIEELRRTFDEIEKQSLLKQLDGEIINDVPAIFLFTPIYYYASDFSVKNIKLENFAFKSDRFANISEWYVVEKEENIEEE